MTLSFKKIIYLLISLILALGMVAPSLSLPRSLIDDGVDFCVIENIDHAWRASQFKTAFLSHFEPSSGRTRPFAWFLRWGVFRLFGDQPFVQHALKVGLLLITVLCIFGIALELTESPLAGFLSSLFFILTIPSLEAYYRLGNTEPFLVLGIAGSLYFLLAAQKIADEKIFYLSCISLLVAYGSKENALALIPFSGLIWWAIPSQSGKKYFIFNCILGISLLGAAWLFTAKNLNTGYTAAYDLNLSKMFANLVGNLSMVYHTYYLLFPLSIGYLLFSLYRKKTSDWAMKWSMLFLACFLLFLLIQIPWGHVMWRYLLVGFLPLSLLIGIQLNEILHWIWASKYKGVKWAGSFGVIILVLHFTMANGIGVYAGFNDYLQSETINDQLISYLGQFLPKNSKLYMNFNGSELNEWYEETKLHLNKFYNRRDLTIKCLYPQPAEGFSKGDYILIWSENGFYPEEKLKDVLKSKFTEKLVIETNYSILLQKRAIYWKLLQIT